MKTENLIRRSIKRSQRKKALLLKRDTLFSYWRLSIVVLGLLLLVLALYLKSEALSWLAVVVLIFIFGVISWLHKKLRERIRKFNLYEELKEEQLNRLYLNWQALPAKNFRWDSNHPFAKDLNIFGDYSLMRLLDTSTSQQAGQRLMNWLSTEEPQAQEIMKRQELVAVLRPLNNLRRKFLLRARMASEELFDGDKLVHWLKASLQKKMPGYLLPLLILLALSTAALFVFKNMISDTPLWSLSFIVYVSLFITFGGYVGNIFSEGLALSDEIRKIQNLLQLLEIYHFKKQNPLNKLLAPIRQNNFLASGKIRSVHHLVFLMGLRENPIVRILVNAIFPVDFLLNYFFQRQRKQFVRDLPLWLDVLYELDALSALAGFAALHPEYRFPKFQQGNEHILFEAQEMSHPLLSAKSKKANSFSLDKKGEISLITGSNMSGKSTFLRTVGINLVLAYAGTVVDAAQMRTSFFRLQTCINVDDSLSGGLSYFYAEVKRLKKILTALEQPEARPVFYLIDEIYKGTNNRERLAGSRAYIRALSAKNGLGIVTTHDLELTALEKEIEHLQNFHFSEQISNGKMYFDYQLKPGPCPSTNALKIMEMEGLPIG